MMKKNKRLIKECRRCVSALTVSVAFTLILLLAPFGVAEGTEDTQENAADREYQVESIIVTAEKQAENVQEVPVSISVFGEQDIEDRNIESIRDVGDYVPNLMLFYDGVSGMNSPSMRGIRAPLESSTVSTGLYVDGVPVLSAIGFEDGMLDVERIEVLRGPQSTLYGKSTEAGVINVITHQPDNEFRGRVSAEGGRLLSAETGDRTKGVFSLNASGPIQEDKLFLGVAGEYYSKDGFIENTTTGDTVDDLEHWSGRAHLRWTPTRKLDVAIIASRLEYDDGAPAMNTTELWASAYGLPTPGYRRVSSNAEGSNTSTSDSESLKIVYDMGNSMTLTSVTARRVYNNDLFADYDYSSATLSHSRNDNRYSKISQELRLDQSSEGLKWLAGLYYDKDCAEIDLETTSDYAFMATTTNRDIDGDTYAVFGNVTFPLAERLNMVTGLRYEKNEKDFEDNFTDEKKDDSWNALTAKVALKYHLKPTLMAYISVSQGYRSGGYNPSATNSNYYSYDEEKLWSYEIGAKSAFFKNRLILNGSIYLMDISDMQVTEAVSPTESYLTNAAEAMGTGIELEMTARVTKGLTFIAGVGYNDIEFDEFEDALGNYENNNNPYAPNYTFNIGGQYRASNGFYVRGDLIGYGKMYFDRANKYSRDAYQVFNAKIGYETERFDVYLYGENIFDTAYDSDGHFSGYYTVYSDPGEAGLKIVYRF